jgi:dynein intermediate chain
MPIDTQELCLKNAANRNVYATCFDFQVTIDDSSEIQEEINNNSLSNQFSFVPKTAAANCNNNGNRAINNQQIIVVGGEDGLVHTVTASNNNKNNNKFITCDSFSEHFGPLTSVSCYNQCLPHLNDYSMQTNKSLSQLFLTSSFDSTIKLWNSMDSSNAIHTFETSGEYVYDLAWSPIHPALFAAVDGSGKLDLWNLNKDTEMPTATIEIDNGVRAINKLKWSRSGTEIVVGDDHGQITIFEINENFARPDKDETRKFLNTLDNLKLLNYETARANNSFNYLIEPFR